MTSILTKEEFIEKYPDNGFFSNRKFEPNEHFESLFFLEFKDPEFLCCPYEGKYAHVRVTNERHGNQKLKSEIQNYNNFVKNSNSKMYNLAPGIAKEMPNKYSCEYISGQYDLTTGKPVSISQIHNIDRFFEVNSDPESASLNHPYLEKHICSADYYSSVELMTAIQTLLKTKTPEEVSFLLEQSKTKINAEISRFERISNISYDRPYFLHISGTDDTSYAASFSTLEELNEVLDIIKQNPTFDTINEYLEFYN